MGLNQYQKPLRLYEYNSLNPEKVNTYIYKSFLHQDLELTEHLQKHINKQSLVDMLTFERVDFTKSISLSVKKKNINWADVWKTNNVIPLNQPTNILKGSSITKSKTGNGIIPVIAGERSLLISTINLIEQGYNNNKRIGCKPGFVNFYSENIFASDCITIQSKNENKYSTKLIYLFLMQNQNIIYKMQRGQAQPHVYTNDLETIKIPDIDPGIQLKILEHIKLIEGEEQEKTGSIISLKIRIEEIAQSIV